MKLPSRTSLAAWAYLAAILGVLYVVAFVLLGAAMLPGGAGFCLLLVYVLASLCGDVVKALSPRLPPLLGMLLAGLVLRNVPSVLDATAPVLGHGFDWWSSQARAGALAVIMLRAGLGLDLQKLRKLGLLTARLAFGPCLAEALTVALLAAPLLELPPAWGGTLGFVIAAVSPAVVVPGMLDLQERGYGVARGVPTMVVAAASFDDVLAIAGFGVCLALAVASEGGDDGGGDGGDGGALAWLILKAPVELLAGVAAGLLGGAAVSAPHECVCGSGVGSPPPGRRFVAALGAAALCVFGGKALNFAGGGALGAVVLGAAAARGWGDEARAPVRAAVNAAWARAQPALFGLLGAAVDLHAIVPSLLWRGALVLAGSLVVRICVTRVAVACSPLTHREARLVCVAWLPKATVQAAVGGVALDVMRERGLGAEAEARGALVLMLSVLVILATAPVGAIGIAAAGPRWLEREVPKVVGEAVSTTEAPADDDEEEAGPNGSV